MDGWVWIWIWIIEKEMNGWRRDVFHFAIEKSALVAVSAWLRLLLLLLGRLPLATCSTCGATQAVSEWFLIRVLGSKENDKISRTRLIRWLFRLL